MSNDLITVAAIQALPIGHFLNPENVPHALELLKQAAEQKADIACFPEAYPATGEEETLTAKIDLQGARQARSLWNDCFFGVVQAEGCKCGVTTFNRPIRPLNNKGLICLFILVHSKGMFPNYQVDFAFHLG